MCETKKNCGCGCPVKQKLKEASETKKITLVVKDPENTITDLLQTIKRIGNTGHGFDIIVDPELKSENDEDGIKTEFYWDGDGGDTITDISIENLDENNMGGDSAVDPAEVAENKSYLTPGVNEDASPEFKKAWKKGMDKDFAEVEKELHEAKGPKIDACSTKVLGLLKKYYKKMAAMQSKIGGKFMGFTAGEGKDNREIQNLKNEAWAVARRGNLDTNEIMILDKRAQMEVQGKTKMTEAEDFNYYMNWADQLRANGEAHGYKIMKGKAEAAKSGNLIDGEIVENNQINEASRVNLKLTSNAKRDLIKKAKTALDAIYAIYDICERLGIDNQKFVDQLDEAFEGTNEMLTILVVQNSIEPVFKK